MSERVRVFWMPGCSSCLRTKEFLTSRGIDYDSIDVANDPEGERDLLNMGARGLPVVAIGNRWVVAQSTRVVAEFVGVSYNLVALDPPELVAKYDKILSGALRYAAQIPRNQFGSHLPKRKRTYGELAWHIFRVADAYLEAAGGGVLTYAALAESIPDRMRSSDDVIAYGQDVHRRLLKWWDDEEDRSGARPLKTFYGDFRLQEVLERSTWHSGQHVRQLMLVLDELGIEPDGRLGAEDFDGLPMPANVWDDEQQFRTAAA